MGKPKSALNNFSNCRMFSVFSQMCGSFRERVVVCCLLRRFSLKEKSPSFSPSCEQTCVSVCVRQ